MTIIGTVQGSAAQAVPLVIGKDTVYVHTDIRELPPDEESGRGEGLFEYHEVQYGKDEYITIMAEQTQGQTVVVEDLGAAFDALLEVL